MKLNIYIEKNIITDNLYGENKFIEALSDFSHVSDAINIHIVMNNSDEELIELEQYFVFDKFMGTFDDLFKSYEKITKDEVYVSYDSEKLFKWDENRGKSILVMNCPHSHDSELMFNKIYLTKTKEEIVKKLRSYIHI